MDKSELDEELLREIASVGGGYGAKIEKYMREMERLRKAIFYLRSRIEKGKGTPLFSMKMSVRLRKRFMKVREEAYKHRFYLIIYREALGLLRHREVYELYNIESLEL